MGKKLLFIINNLRSGGTQKHVVKLVNELSERGYDVTLALLSASEKEELFFRPELNDSVKVSNLTSRFKTLTVIKLIFKIYHDNWYLISNYLESANILGSIIPRILKGKNIKIINNIRGNRQMNYSMIHLWEYTVDSIIVNSSQIESELKEIGIKERKIHLIYNGIDTRAKIPKITPKIFSVLHVGTISKVKNQKELLRALVLLKEAYEFQVDIVGFVGDQNYYNELLEYCDTNNLDMVNFVEGTSDIESYYSKSSVLILTSLSEGLPNVVMESMVHGLPVISSDVGDVGKLIDHGKNGFLYKSGDYQELKNYVEHYINVDSHKIKSIGKYSKKKIEDFGIDEMVNQHVDVFFN